MPSVDRDDSQDRELVRHSHSFSSDGRLSIPMWDSSDPERAPPPLPLNTGSPVLTTRHNTSTAIANAANALAEKARESLPASSYTTNPMPQRSPDRSLIKGAQHKRMQSLQPNGVRDLKSFLDTHKSPERSPERPATGAGTPSRDVEKDYFGGDFSPFSPSRIGTPTPSTRDALKETPALRPSVRSQHKSILGENTPPSATMMALQTMTVPPHVLDPPLSNVTDTPSKPPQPTPQTFDAISNQLLSITTIVSNLQKDMTQLSRRSKDNATDLVGLKEATSQRDEDIRKSLKDLVNTMSLAQGPFGTPGELARSGSRDPHMTPTKPFSIPRLASPSSFFLDDRMSSPNPYSVEGAASVAMLEKIIREMVTKDGQERLINNLQMMMDNANGETAKKVTDLVEFVKQSSAHNALVPVTPGSTAFQPSPGSGPLTRSSQESFPLHKVSDDGKPYASPKAADFVSEEMLKFLRKIKDSVAETGGVMMGNKAVIQELRGEVLGMGRELARKIEEAVSEKSEHPTTESGQPNAEIGYIIQEGLADLKEHMDKVMRDRRRQSMSSTVTRTTVDNNEVYNVVKHALAEHGLDRYSPQSASLDKEAIVSAVREAYEEYKPNVEAPHFGLERDEILDCLHEGLQEYHASEGATKEEIEKIVQNALQHVQLPPPINETHEIRDEVLLAVRDCLEDFKPSVVTHPASSNDLSREVILDVMREALSTHDFSTGPSEIDIPQEVFTDAVRAGLASYGSPNLADDSAVMQRLHSLVDDMHAEFKAYSSANGRDTEQVLDALRDGLDHLRSEIESYVDKAQDVTHKDEIVDNIRSELESLRVDIQGFIAQDARSDQSQNHDEILTVLSAGFEGMRSQVVTRGLDLESNEEINEAMKQEFDQLKEVILGDNTNHHDEVLDRLQAGFDLLHARLGEESTATASTNDEGVANLKEELEHLRETLAGSLVRSGGTADNDDIVDAVRELIEGLRSTQENSARDNTAAIQADLETLKDSLSNTLVRAGDSSEKEVILDALKIGIEEIKESSRSLGINEELLEALREELDQVRQSNALTRQHARADTEEVLEVVRLGLDDLRSHMEKKLDSPGRQGSATNEIMDALNDGLDSLRTDVVKAVDKPVDMTVSYEILDTLKAGLADLREDIEKLKGKVETTEAEEQHTPTGNEVVLADDPESAQAEAANREIVADPVPSSDLERVEVLLSQLQIKVEAMDANIQNPIAPAEPTAAAGTAMKDDLSGIETLLKDVQTAVLVLQDREHSIPPVGLASKEDTDAIETLLGNLKAKIDELPLPEPATIVTKENLDEVELVVRTTSEAVDALSKKLEEDGATKADVTVVQVIADDIKLAIEELKTTKPDDEADPKATKADVDSLTLLIDEIKAKVDEMKLPDPDAVPSKADVEELVGLIHEFRESHDAMKSQYENDIEITASHSDHRKKEAEDLLENLAEVKVVLDEFKEEVKASLIEGSPIQGLQESFKSLEESIDTNFNVTADVKDLMETVSREFQRAHGSIEALQNDQAEKSALQLEKHDEAKDAIIAGLVENIDSRFDTLMTKYDDAQLLADEQAKVMKEKAEEQEKILEGTKAMADELRLTIDTLGTSITSMNDRFEEATVKWSTDSATVFSKIDDATAKLEDQKLEEKTEHSHTRDEIKNIERIFEGFQDNVTEYHPKFMVALREIEALVKAHYEHAQGAKDEAAEHARAMNERSEELQNHFSSLPALLPSAAPAIEMPEKYDDAQVLEKLDKLLGHVDEAENAANQLERLDEIHAQVKLTASEVSDFVAKQTQLITDGNESKEREAEELALLVERRTTQKEQLETELQELKAEKERVMQEWKDEKERAMTELKEEKDRTIQEVKEEKDSLLAVVAALQAERANLADQKIRLTGEVSSLHTALDIRREELHLMDAKADALERRILNGIMDHSRALMIAKGGPKNHNKTKKRMSADISADADKLMPPPNPAARGLSLALKPRPAIRRNGPPLNPASRRIHSLGQISGNAQPGAQTYPTTNNAMSKSSGLTRSHSVKTNYLRKSSWNGRPSAVVANKENEILSEEDETTAEQAVTLLDDRSIIEEDQDEVESQTGTERRHSFGTGSYTESYAEGETPGYDGRSSFGGTGSEYTYASGSSYMTGSEVDRRSSYGSTARSAAPDGTETIDEHSEDETSHSEHSDPEDEEPTATIDFANATVNAPAPSEISTTSALTEDMRPTDSEIHRHVEGLVEEVKAEMKDEGYAMPKDSGVGSELPTAALGIESEMDADYFRRAAEEESMVG